MRRELSLLVVAGLAVSLTTCGGDNGTRDETAATPTTTAEAVTTVAPATTVDEQPKSDAGPFPAGEPVDLVYIADSSSVGEPYAELTAEMLDREVRLNERVDASAQSIRGRFADDVAEAEIIVFYFNSAAFEKDMPPPTFEASCVLGVDALEVPDCSGPEWTPGTKWEPVPAVPTAEDWQPYEDWLSEVWEAIWDARDGRPVVLRGHDMFNPWFGQWVELGIEPECTAVWEGQATAARQAAEANGAVFVSFYDVLNGPDHDEDARAKGWVWEDGMHANEAGRAVAAEALAAVGFELNERPG